MKQQRKRLFISKKSSEKERENLIKLALENQCNTLVFPLDDIVFKKGKNFKYLKLAKHHVLNIEAGGRELSLLMPKSLFLSDSSLFRMENGKRTREHHFCPTNPKTTAIIAKNARRLFAGTMEMVTTPRIYHLQPEEGYESTWCQCPACRAFRPAEQYLIAVNAAAAELAKFDDEAKIIYVDFDSEPEAASVKPRNNVVSCC